MTSRNEPTTTLIRGGVVLPMEGAKRAFDPGSVLIVGTDIAAVGAVEEVDAHPAASGADVVDATGHAVIPGLHNAHLHSGLLRGTAESMSLWDWLRSYVDPAHAVMTPEIAKAASYLAYTEGLRFGTTSVLDMWRFMEGSAEAAAAVGIRATLAPYVADAEGYDYFESIESNRALLETHRSGAGGRVRTWLGLEHLFYCTPEAFRAAAELAAEFDTGIHTHSSETENNNLDMVEEMKFGSLLQKVSTVDLRRPHFVPVLSGPHFNVPAHLVFSASGHGVADVWVDGRRLVSGGEVLSVDVEAVRRDAQLAAEELFERRERHLAAQQRRLRPPSPPGSGP